MASDRSLPHCDESPTGDDDDAPLTLRERALVGALTRIIVRQLRAELAAEVESKPTSVLHQLETEGRHT